ncbi:MAG: phosphoribosylformylglycinamidine cyclo-ligase [Actinomycetota bacterium]|nr:phosphoribosylformylglycinamidine cyclo-ligase [Actinomycetota bacterium]
MSGGYRGAGVDLDAAQEAVDAVRILAAAAARPEVATGVGGFAGLFRIGHGRMLAASTDGVGTKLEVARWMGRLDTVGIDLVAMCANDVVCTGAEPLFFLDYLAAGRVVPQRVAEIVAGVAEGCRRAGCALLGGETAEHPGVMDDDRFDLAGFCVGVVDEDAALGPERGRPGDILIGLLSSGLHSNGYSLVRRIVADAGLDLQGDPGGLGRTLGEELLEPTRIYVAEVLAAARTGAVRSAAHVTGGGVPENVPRALPDGLGAALDPGAWTVPPVFRFLAEVSGTPEAEMRRTFNMGLGMVLVVDPAGAADVLAAAAGARVVGRVVPEAGVRFG